MLRIAVLSRGPREHVDAILEHGRRLAEAMRATGAEVDMILREPDGSWMLERPDGEAAAGKLIDALLAYDLIVVQYNPFLWGRRGFAPWLPVVLWRLRLRRRRPRIGLFVHETYLDLELPWRWLAMGLWQRVQLWVTRPAADVIFVSIEAWTTQLARWIPRRPTSHVPGGSNLPDAASERDATRAEIEAGRNTLVVATLSGGEPARRHDLIAAAIQRLVEAGHDTLLLALGTGGATPEGAPASLRVIRPGRLSDTDLARHVAAADIFLAPFPDGISTRRTSAMAPLQHGVPVVATRGHLTDSLWSEASPAVRLAPVDRPDLFAAAALELAADPAAREEAAAAARALYSTRFDWSHAAAIILAAAEHRGATR